MSIKRNNKTIANSVKPVNLTAGESVDLTYIARVNAYGNLTNIVVVGNNSNKSIKKLIDNAYGVRIIHTDLFESIITFIISANNNMKRIKANNQKKKGNE